MLDPSVGLTSTRSQAEHCRPPEYLLTQFMVLHEKHRYRCGFCTSFLTAFISRRGIFVSRGRHGMRVGTTMMLEGTHRTESGLSPAGTF